MDGQPIASYVQGNGLTGVAAFKSSSGSGWLHPYLLAYPSGWVLYLYLVGQVVEQILSEYFWMFLSDQIFDNGIDPFIASIGNCGVHDPFHHPHQWSFNNWSEMLSTLSWIEITVGESNTGEFSNRDFPVHKIETFRWWHSNQFMHESKADKRCIPLLWCDGNLRATQVFTFRSIRWVGDIDRSGVQWRWFPCWTGTRILLMHQFWNPLFGSFT